MATPEKPAPVSAADALLKRLLQSGAALMERRGELLLMTREEGRQRALPRALARVARGLIENGALIAGDDGLFRPRGAEVRTMVNQEESPLEKILLHKSLSKGSFFDRELVRAGERLRRDFEQSHLSQRVTARYDPVQAGPDRHWQFSDNAMENFSAAVFAARRRVHDALEAVGPELSGLLLQVCCLVSGLEEAERRLQLPRRSAKAVLALGLTRLARHYGLKPQLRHAGPAQIGHWAMVDYRPAIMPPQHPT